MKITILQAHEYANTYVIGNENEHCIIIDPGYNENKSINSFIKKHYSGVDAILLTHGHYDHIAGITKLIEDYPCKVMIHSEEVEKLTNYKLNVSGVMHKVIIHNANTYEIEDEDEINIIGLSVKVIHTPFHTNGSVCYYISGLNALFTGDTLFHLSIGRSDLPTGSYKTIENSLRKITILPINTIIFPGHGEKTILENELKYNEYFKF